MQSRTGPYAFVCGSAGGRSSQYRRGPAAFCATSKAVGEAPLTLHATDDTSIQVREDPTDYESEAMALLQSLNGDKWLVACRCCIR